MKIINHNQLNDCNLIIDAIYASTNIGNLGDETISKIFKVNNQGGFRISGKTQKPNYIVLFTTNDSADWPDSIDLETGIFKYYGDNRTPGKSIHDTKKKGNEILKNLFDSLHSEVNPRGNVPPIFVFEKHPILNSSRAVQFKGLCVPGAKSVDSTLDLVAIWKTKDGNRFQNYLAYFTILDIPIIKREWINDLNKGNENSVYAPKEYIEWKIKGKYKALTSKKTIAIRSIDEQLPTQKMGKDFLHIIWKYFCDEPTAFEFMASDIFKMSNTNIIIDEITRGTIDGGRDALGRMKIGIDSDPIYVDFILEAKCYNPGQFAGKVNTVGVKETSRLISRIRNRQFGVLVTTSAIAMQAYQEVRLDNHPIIFISGKDIVTILIEKGINSIGKLKRYLTDNYKLKKL